MSHGDTDVQGGALHEIMHRVADRFRRREVRERVTGYLQALLDRVERKNGWPSNGYGKVLLSIRWN